VVDVPEHYDLDRFRHNVFAPGYRRGQHMFFMGRTQFAGKTTMAFALLDAVTEPDFPGTVFCMKTQDRVVSALTRRLGYIETPHWPPPRKLSNWHPRGHTLWPPQALKNPEADEARLEREFDAALLWHQRHVPGIVFADELQGLVALKKLRARLRAVVTRAGGAGLGLWYANQKATGIREAPIDGYFKNSPTWTLMARDPDERNLDAYSDISAGIPAKSIHEQVLKLDRNSWLAINRDGPYWCVVDAYDPAWKV
jgi:hypothetical protein